MSRRAYSLIEITVALVVVGIVLAVTFPTLRAFEDRGSDSKTKAQLQATDVELQRYGLGRSDRRFGDQNTPILLTSLNVGGITFSDGTTASQLANSTTYTVSVATNSPYTSAVATTRSASGVCWIIVVRLDGATTWGRDRSPGSGVCRAGNPLIVPSAISGTAKSPTEIDIG